MPNVETILRDRTTLQVECIDRLYLQGYVPSLQRPGQLSWFFTDHRGKPLPSPALMKQMTDRFVKNIKGFAERHRIPIVQFKRGERKDDIAKKRYARFKREEGVVFIGVAQEKARAFRSKPRRRKDGSASSFEFYQASVAVNQYYFYIVDKQWGPGFIKFSSYVPFGVRVCINGHEWAKCQLRNRGIAFEALDNGFRSCEDPETLQKLCDQLSDKDVQRYFNRWLNRLPHPFTRQDQAMRYRYQLSIWQMELSLTHVFERPLAGRQFFEEIIRENLDLGRPDRIQLLFGRQVRLRGKHPTPSSFRTRVVHHGVLPKLSVQYKRSFVKQYFKENRALRTETVINNTYDVGVKKLLPNLPYLKKVARNINRRLLSLERVSHNCVITSRTFESIVLPSHKQGQHAPGLRFGDPRVMAALAALCHFLPAPNGFTNKMLRQRIAPFFDAGPKGYSGSRMTYDLRRLRLNGIIKRLPKKNRYVLTESGRRVALFFSKTYTRILKPGLSRLEPNSPTQTRDPLAKAWRSLDDAVEKLVADANLTP